MERNVKWGVLGCAGIAVNHVIPAMEKAKGVTLYGIASRSEEKRSAVAAKFAFEKTYDSYNALLEDPEIEAVYIPLPNALHQEWTVKAAEHGKHILCEKPLALTAKGCMEMAETCKKNNVKLMEAFMYRFTDRMKTVKELIDQKVIGEIAHIYSTHRFLLDNSEDVRVNRQLGGGALRDIGCYPVNFISWILGKEPVHILAQCTRYQEVDFTLDAILSYDNGVMASLSCGFNGHSSLLTEISGTKGSIVIRDSFIDSAVPVLVLPDKGLPYEVAVKEQDCYQLEVEEITAAILEGREPALSLDETISNNKIIEQILKIVEK